MGLRVFALALALAASPEAERSRQEFDRALDAARAAVGTEQALELYEEAWKHGQLTILAGGFGTMRLHLPVGDLQQGDYRGLEQDVPAGFEVLEHLAAEAAHAANRLGRPLLAVDWAKRRGTLGALPRDGLPAETRRLLGELRDEARALPDAAKAVAVFDALLERDEADALERARLEDEERRRYRLGAAGAGLALLALAGWYLLKLALAVFAARRETTGGGGADFVLFSGVTILERDPEGRPTRWKTSRFDFGARLVLGGMILSTAPLALVGAAVFAPLAWRQSGPDNLGVTLLLYGLADLFVAYAVFIVLLHLVSPPDAVRREIQLCGDAVLVRTRYGVWSPRVVEERFPFSAIRRLHIVEHLVPAQHTTVRYYLPTLEFEGRRIVIGGGTPERGVELLSPIARVVGLPIG